MSGVAIVAASAITAVGLSLPETAASARARVARLREIEWMDRRFEPFIVGRVPDDGLPPLAAPLATRGIGFREARLLRLAHLALEQALDGIDTGGELPLLLGLPEHHTTQRVDPVRFVQRLALQSGVALDVRTSVAVPAGRAAPLMALREAAARLARGEGRFVAVGGVDTLVEPYVLSTLDQEGRVRTEVNSDGLRPAEGAGMLLLASAATVQAQGLQPLAWLRGCASGQEPGHLYADAPYLGEGLAGTFERLFAETPPPAPVGCVYASFTGERYWAREYSVARTRHADAFDPEHAIEHPAEVFGDLGAATGAVLAALAADGMAGGYRRSPCLVFASSDHAERAAALLTRQPN